MDWHLTKAKSHHLPKDEHYYELLKSAQKYVPPNQDEVLGFSPQKMEVNTHLHEQRGDKTKIEVDVNDNRKCVKRQLTLDP